MLTPSEKPTLDGIVVLELANVLAGPSVGMFLAELGARVIKVENLKTQGDVTRSWKLKEESAEEDISAYFACANWGKEALALDISKPEGRAIIHKLITKTDIVLASYKAGDADKLQMDFKSLSTLNSKLIYASISGYGENDNRTAYDAVLQAETGYMSMNGEPDSAGLKLPIAIVDVLAAHQMKEAILLALLKKEKTGEGSHISVSLTQSALTGLVNQATNYLFTGKYPKPMGSEHPNIAPYGETFETNDGRRILLAVGSEKQFDGLLKFLGIQSSFKFKGNANRISNRKELQTILAEAILKFDSGILLAGLHENQVPCGMVQNVGEALDDPNAREMILHSGPYKAVRQTSFHGLEMSKDITPPPHFGEQTPAILKEFLGIKDEEIDRLLAENVIV